MQFFFILLLHFEVGGCFNQVEIKHGQFQYSLAAPPNTILYFLFYYFPMYLHTLIYFFNSHASTLVFLSSTVKMEHVPVGD